MAKVLFVVHRYAPFPGGSEIYVQNMAEEMLKRGHDVTVLAGTHDPNVLAAGDYHGVKVTSDHNILLKPFDLIIVHGADVGSQDVVHMNAHQIPSPVLYLLIKPSVSPAAMTGLRAHRFLGVSTQEDRDHLEMNGVRVKGRQVRHGIRLEDSIGQKHAPKAFKTFVSVGGFWAHKGFQELAVAFTEAMGHRTDYQLHLYGYDQAHLAPQETDQIKCFYGRPREEVMDAIANADLYIMNSYEEGFGLVLLEAMVNEVPWAARNIAGATLLSDHGCTYDDKNGLMRIMDSFANQKTDSIYKTKLTTAKNYVLKNHLIQNTVDDILEVYRESIEDI